MTHIDKNSVVAFHCDTYEITGEQLGSSRAGLPLLFCFGGKDIPLALQQAMLGRQTGDRFQVTLPPEKAYGHRDPELVQKLPLDMLPESLNLKIGAMLTAHTEEGERQVRVTAFDEQFVTLDGNHPLAGKELNFDVEIRNVRPASEKEIAQGVAIP